MKRVFLFVMCLVMALSAEAQTAADLNEGLQVTTGAQAGDFTVSWWGKTGRTYFVQQSFDLMTWQYVPVVCSGVEAVELARKHRPDLILMDIQLPEVSGLQVTQWIKADEELRAIPVVAVTAFAMKGDEERIREGGCEAYISKPISVAHFLETIKRLLD